MDRRVENTRVTLDPIYGYIEMPQELDPVIDNTISQRLRNISQTSTASAVFPSLNVSRFSHALGAMHLATRAWSSAAKNADPELLSSFADAVANDVRHIKQNDQTDDEPSIDKFVNNIKIALASTAFLHDIGHPPFSHALEWVLLLLPDIAFSNSAVPGIVAASGLSFHEAVGQVLGNEILEPLQTPAAQAARLIVDKSESRGWVAPLRTLIDSEIDIDRIDYLLRDNHAAGTEYGAFDYERILDSVELRRDKRGRFATGLGSRARSGAEQLLLQRMQTYRWVIFHPRVVASDHALARSVEILLRLSRSEAVVKRGGDDHPLGSLFDSLRPNLDYVSAHSTSANSRLQPAIDEFVGNIEPTLVNDAEIGRINAERRGSVDDGAVKKWLQDGLLTARLLLSSNQVTIEDFETRTELERLIPLTTEAVFRAKKLLPAWKNHEEYADVAKAIMTTIKSDRIVETAWDELSGEFDDEPARAHRDEVLAKLYGEDAWDHRSTRQLSDQAMGPWTAVTAFNFFVDLVVDRPGLSLARFLQQRSNSPSVGLSGWWEATFRDFQPLKRLTGSSFLFKGDERVSLVNTSPLVNSIPWIDDQRTKLFVFYCRSEKADTGERTSSEIRRDIRNNFVQYFPEFFKSEYIRTERRFLSRLMEEKP